MDLQLYARVLWRFRFLVLAGIVIGTGLAILSFARVSFENGSLTSPKVSYRESEQWVSEAKLFVTQRGFPWGRSITSDEVPIPGSSAGSPGRRFADPGRFTDLAILYSQLATSDPVRTLMLKDGPIKGEVKASPVLALPNGGGALPLIDVAAIAESKTGAILLARRVTGAMREYIHRQQDANQVPARDRVSMEVLAEPKEAELYRGRSITVPVFVFLSVLVATMALSFILENIRPRIKRAAEPSLARSTSVVRRTA